MKRIRNASITVEAALVTPIFLYAILFFISFIQIYIIQLDVGQALMKTAEFTSKYAYVYEYLIDIPSEEDINENTQEEVDVVEQLVDSTLIKIKVDEYLHDQTKKHKYILGQPFGFVLLESTFMQDDEWIEIICRYQIKFPFPIIKIKNISLCQKVKIRGFIGSYAVCPEREMKEEEKDEYVFITEHGTVYHKSNECSYIKVKVESTALSTIGEQRNSSQGKYYGCKLCGKKAVDVVYIAKYGSSYHSSKTCSAIKRDVQKVRLSEVGSKRVCSKCGGDNH